MIPITQDFMNFVLTVDGVIIVCFVVVGLFINIRRITDFFRK